MRRFYLSRRRSRLIVFVGFLAFFVAVAISVQSRKPSPSETQPDMQTTSVTDKQDGSAATSSFLVLENFHRTERREDGKGWEIRASKGEYDSVGSGVNLTDAVVVLFQPSGQPTKIVAAKAKVVLVGEDLAGVDATGGVTLEYGEQVVVTTEVARYEKSSGIIESDGPATFVGDGFNINGGQMRASVDENWIKLSSGVQSRFESRNVKVFPELNVGDSSSVNGSVNGSESIVKPAKEKEVGKSRGMPSAMIKSPAKKKVQQRGGKKQADKKD